MYLATSFVAELGDDCDLKWRLFGVQNYSAVHTLPVCFIIGDVVQFCLIIVFLLACLPLLNPSPD